MSGLLEGCSFQLLSPIYDFICSMKKVVILQHRLMHYRVSFFERVRELGALGGIEVVLVHGQPSKSEALKRDTGELDGAFVVKNFYLRFFGRDLLWQPFPSKLNSADLVVVMQENRILSNYLIILRRLLTRRLVAYWGHGANLQSLSRDGLLERWKRYWMTKVDWWFAYSKVTTDILERAGYPGERVTCLNNAIDTSGFKKELSQISRREVESFKSELGISVNAVVGIFCGSLYPDKRITFVVNACELIRQSGVDFHCIVIGDGEERKIVDALSVDRPWLHVLGKQIGRRKALGFKASTLLLNPGLVGLNVVDGFSAGLVMITVADSRHGPEFAYLKDGSNGLVVDGDVVEYASVAVGLIRNERRLRLMRDAALADSDKYTVESMAERFVDGISKCLNARCH